MGGGGISLPDATALPKPIIISWECKDLCCTKPSGCGCTEALERQESVASFSPSLSFLIHD